MINTIQPFINLANANMAAFARFAQSPEITDLTKQNIDKYGKVARDSFGQVAQSDALNELTRTTMQNFSRFATEYTQSLFGLMSQSQNLLARPLQEASRRVEEGLGATTRVLERAGNAMDEAQARSERERHDEEAQQHEAAQHERARQKQQRAG